MRLFVLASLLVFFDDSSMRAHAAAAEAPMQQAMAALYIDDHRYGDVIVELGQPDQSSVEAETLLAVLRSALDPPALRRVQAVVTSQGTLPFAALTKLGIGVQFDESDIALRVSLSPSVRGQKRVDLGGQSARPPANLDQALRPARISGALDVDVGSVLRNGDYDSFDAQFDAHINVLGWVAETRLSYEHDRDGGGFHRTQSRLVKDWTSKLLRQSFGDVAYPIRGLMGYRALTGAALTTSFDLQPYSVFYPVADRELFLDEAARVDVYVNGSRRQSLQLGAGPHILSDLPVSDGINEIKLEITDSAGRRIVDFSALRDDRLLAAGRNEFSIAGGIERKYRPNAGVDYDSDGSAISSFYRRGITSGLTLGGHLEGDRKIAMGGLTAEVSTILGRFGLDLGMSNDEEGIGGGALLTHRFRKPPWSTVASLLLQTRDFATLSQDADDGNPQYLASLNVTLPRTWGISTSVRAGAGQSWEGGNRYTQGLLFSRAFGAQWQASVDVSHGLDEGDSEVTALFQVSWSPTPRVRATARFDTDRKATEVEVDYRRQGELGLAARAAIADTGPYGAYRLDSDYVAPQFEARVDVSENQGGSKDNYGGMRLASALVFADGQFAISRPTRGLPFALVRGGGSVRDIDIGVTRNAGALPIAYLGSIGNRGVVPNLTPYYAKDVRLDLRDVPMDTQLDNENFLVMPGYRSGFLLEVGVRQVVYAVGKLLDGNGEPVVLALGTLHSIDAPQTPIQFFTDANGQFEIGELQPGRYELTSVTRSGQRAILEVPPNATGIMEIGTVRLASPKEE